MIFDYIALNRSNNKVEGEVSATDLASARKRLHGMGLTVLAVNERKADAQASQQTREKGDYVSFEFRGIDQKGKEIVGTIDAKDALQAYIRLKQEFFFDVKSLFDLDADEIEKERQKKELAKELQQKYELAGLAEEEHNAQKEEYELAEIEKKNVEKFELLRNQIDVMIAQINTILFKVKDVQEKRAEIQRIKKLIGDLERIKMSNNIKHIKGVAERILELSESLFKGKDEYNVVIKQKEHFKSFDLEKLQQMQYREATEIKGIAGALNKASGLFKKYLSKITTEKKTPIVSDKVLDKQAEASEFLLARGNLLDKTQKELESSLKDNVKLLFNFGKTPSFERRVAFYNIGILLKVFFQKFKKEKLGKNKVSVFFLKLLKRKEIDRNKQDYQTLFVEINSFLGWLLCFYLGYFYFGALVLQKNFPFFRTFFYKTVYSEFLLILLFTFFLFHLLTNLKIKFFRQSFLATFLLFLLGSFSIVLFALNY